MVLCSSFQGYYCFLFQSMRTRVCHNNDGGEISTLEHLLSIFNQTDIIEEIQKKNK
ncbi:uncharacterized protein DS421_16g543660 [Arachis hypogaea]|nr:uncharacterized protein DS421_16g543660 [Arachis hypogaea]